jgi:hypothetical protein
MLATGDEPAEAQAAPKPRRKAAASKKK